jgi:hypothetical protein
MQADAERRHDPAKTFLRFADLRRRGIITSWPMLKRRTEHDGFPKGRMLGPNTRVWTEEEIEGWLASRPAAIERRRGRPPKTDES